MSAPLATIRLMETWLITFRTYGTWLRGDARGWTDSKRRLQVRRRWGANPALERHQRSLLTHSPVTLDERQRAIVDANIRDECLRMGWTLLALNVRTSHVHLVVATDALPSRVSNHVKAKATRAPRLAGAMAEDQRPWAAGQDARRVLPKNVPAAIDYVLNRQGPDLVPSMAAQRTPTEQGRGGWLQR